MSTVLRLNKNLNRIERTDKTGLFWELVSIK